MFAENGEWFVDGTFAGDITLWRDEMAYYTHFIIPDTSGDYTIRMTSHGTVEDPLLLVYEQPFDPGAPLENLFVANDDTEGLPLPDRYLPTIPDVHLEAHQIYVLVVTTYRPDDLGTVAFDVSGAGTVTHYNTLPVFSFPQETVIDNETANRNVFGTLVITDTGELDGGSIFGSVESEGIMSGDIELGVGSSISGGTISGHITGSRFGAARIDAATVTDGANLSNVVIGPDTRLEPGVTMGANVRFESEASVPPGLDITGALDTLTWRSGDARDVAMLGGDDPVDPPAGSAAMSLIRSLQLLDDYEPAGNSLEQDGNTGELLVLTDDYRASVLPVQVSKADPDARVGTRFNADGDIEFVTANQRVVLGYPALVSAPAFQAVLEQAGLALDYDARAKLRVTPQDADAQGAAQYYSGRPDAVALPAWRGNEAGLMEYTVPGFGGLLNLSLVFEDEHGRLMEQEIAPMPADWSLVREALEVTHGISDVRISAQGEIFLLLDGEPVLGRTDYAVAQGAEPERETLLIRPTVDYTGNGEVDYEIVYPNGDVQRLYVKAGE